MSALEKSRIVTPLELSQILNVTMSWIYQRTGPNATRKPRLPREPWYSDLRFDLDKVFQVLNSASNHSSLKTEKSVRFVSPKKERIYKPLW